MAASANDKKISELPSGTPENIDLIAFVDLAEGVTKKSTKDAFKWDTAILDVGTTITGSPWTDASVTNSGTTSAAIFDFVIPKGNIWDQWDPWDPWDQWDPWDDATLQVGTTTTGSPWTDASVTNRGTTSAAIFDFSIPQGDNWQSNNTYPHNIWKSALQTWDTSWNMDYSYYEEIGFLTKEDILHGKYNVLVFVNRDSPLVSYERESIIYCSPIRDSSYFNGYIHVYNPSQSFPVDNRYINWSVWRVRIVLWPWFSVSNPSPFYVVIQQMYA